MDRPYLKDKYVIALTGGIASGKSCIAEVLSGLGAGIIDTDLISRKIVLPGSPVLETIKKKWGDGVIKNNGSLDRGKMASIIFSSDDDREELNKIMHPAIIEEMIREASECEKKIIVLVIPLLFESGIPICYDEIWLAYTPPEIQKERLQKRDKIDEIEAQKRISSQMPIELKIAKSGVIIDNSGEFDKTLEEVEKNWLLLKEKIKN